MWPNRCESSISLLTPPYVKTAVLLDLKPIARSKCNLAINLWSCRGAQGPGLESGPQAYAGCGTVGCRGSGPPRTRLSTTAGPQVCCETQYSAEGTSSPPRGHEAPPTALWEEPAPRSKMPIPLYFGRNPVGDTSHKRERSLRSTQKHRL